MSYQGPVEDLYLEQKQPVTKIKKLKDQPFYKNFTYISILLATLTVFYRTVTSFALDNELEVNLLIAYIMVLVLTIIKTKEENQISISDKGIKVTNFWVRRKLISWSEIVDIIVEENPTVVKIILDTKWARVNTTGMQDIFLEFNINNYERVDLEAFSKELIKYKNQFSKAPDTLNERLRKQVTIAWDKRFLRIFQNWFDSFTKGLYQILVIIIIIYGFSNYLFNQWILATLLIGFAIFLALIYFFENPYSIVGIRANELGPVLYLPEEILSNIRFVVMAKPFDIKLKHCEVIYDEETKIKQISNMIQIHPELIRKGELTHCVAQITGNHSKSNGIIVKFEMGEKSQEFSIEIRW
jgi:hypothetical protein